MPTKPDPRIGKTMCWCGREWPVDTLRQQCERGDHMEPKR